MANMEPRRKVGYGPRHKSAPAGAGRRPARGSHAAFGALPGDGRAGAWETDAVVGRKADSARPLTLHHGPTGLQLAIPVADGTCAPALAGLGLVRAALGPDGMRRVFRLALTDDGPEFAGEGGIAALGGDARALMDAFGVETLEPAELDLTAGCVERARAERGKAPLAE